MAKYADDDKAYGKVPRKLKKKLPKGQAKGNNKSLKIADAANQITPVKLIRGVPKHVYNLDRKRFEEEYRKIKGIKKA